MARFSLLLRNFYINIKNMTGEREVKLGPIEMERRSAKEYLRWYANVFREQGREHVADFINFIEQGVNEGATLTNGQKGLIMEAIGAALPDLNEKNQVERAIAIATFINSCHK